MLCLLVAGPAHAQPAAGGASPTPAQLAEARKLFQKGVELAKQRQFSAAETRFRAALAIHPAPAVEYNLAAALFELQQHQEAFNRAKAVQRDASTPDALRERAVALERALAPYVARLTVLVGDRAADMTVRVDGQPLAPALFGVPHAVVPGMHIVTASHGAQTVSERSVDVPARTAVIVDLSFLPGTGLDAEPPTHVTRGVAPSEEPTREQQTTRKRRLWTYGAVAAGVVLAAVAVGVGVSLAGRDSERQAAEPGDFQPGVLTWR